MSKNNNNFFSHKNDWSRIKDNILKGYLPAYFQKLLTSKKPIFYVDCFAGKGKFDTGEYGSPLIAVECINKCVQQAKNFLIDDSIQACFIEPYHYVELENNLKFFPLIGGSTTIIPGKFKDSIRVLLQNKKDWNVFLYIDPYGIRALDSIIFDDFTKYDFHSFEMLINFNSFGFFRDACSAMRVDISKDEAFQGLDDLVEYEPTVINSSQQSKDLLTKIAGGDYWIDIVDDYHKKIINGFQAEQRLSNEYKLCLKKRYKYVLDIPIRLKQENRPKYRMVHVSDHEDGCYLMAENMQRRKNELFTRIQQGGQLSLFDISSNYSSTAEGIIITEKDVEEMVRQLIDKMPDETRINVFFARFCNENGVVCQFSMIRSILERMENNNEIIVTRIPSLTATGRKSNFWDEKGGKIISLRRNK